MSGTIKNLSKNPPILISTFTNCKFWVFSFVFLTMGLLSLAAQQSAYYLNFEEMYTKYPDKEAVIQKELVEVNFSRDSKTGEPKLARTEKLYFTSLKSNTHIALNYFRSNNSTFKSRKTSPYQKICGDYEIEGIFHADAKFCNYSFYAQNRGQEFTFEITEYYDDLKYYSLDFFSSEYPTLLKIVNFHIPAWMTVDLHAFNLDKVVHSIDTIHNADDGSITVRYRMNDLPYFKAEPHATSVNANYPHVLVCSRSYQDKKGNVIKLINDLDDLYAWYSSLIKKTSNDTAALRPLLKEIIANCETPADEVKCIFKWVQDNIRYIAFEYEMAGYVPENAQNVVANKYGDCKGVSNLTKELLRMSGFDARLCWVGTKDLIYSYSTPALAVDNHMICALVQNGKITYLDPTASFTEVGKYPEYIQGKEVLIEDGENYIHDTIPVQSGQQNTLSYRFGLALDGNKLSGDLDASITGNNRAQMLSLMRQIDVDEYLVMQNLVLNNDKNIEWNREEYKVVNDSVFRFLAPVVLKKNTLLNSDRLFVKLTPLETFEDNFIDTSRYSAFDFDEKMHVVYQVDFIIPEGYMLDKLPEDFTLDHENYKIEYKYALKDGIVSYNRKFYLKNAVIEKDDFLEWNNFLKLIRKEDNKRIILTKTS